MKKTRDTPPEGTQFQADLLRAARAEKPRKRAVERTLAAAVLIAVESCEGAGAVARSPVRLDLFRRLAMLLGGIVIASAIAFGVVLKAQTPAAPAPLASVSVAPPPAPEPALVVVPSAVEHEPAAPSASFRSATPLPSVAPRASSPARALPPPSTSAAVDRGEDEITMLRRAKRELSSSDARAALATLDAYEHVFPAGLLKEEAEALRVSALMSAGDVGHAKIAGAQFLAAHPDSPYAERVRTVIGSAPSPD